jgi:hypothetical protein
MVFRNFAIVKQDTLFYPNCINTNPSTMKKDDYAHFNKYLPESENMLVGQISVGIREISLANQTNYKIR